LITLTGDDASLHERDGGDSDDEGCKENSKQGVQRTFAQWNQWDNAILLLLYLTKPLIGSCMLLSCNFGYDCTSRGQKFHSLCLCNYHRHSLCSVRLPIY